MKHNPIRRISNPPNRVLNVLFALAAAGCMVYYILMGVHIRFNQSMAWLWPLFSAALLTRHVLVARTIRTGRASPLPRFLIKAVHAGCALFIVSFIVIETIILSVCFTSSEPGLDYIIVLGAKVNGTQPGGALRNRIQVAYEYWTDSPDTVIIASGGQGADEGISEARCIFNGLTARGVPAESILLEQESTSTYENISNSVKLISCDGTPSVGIVTNNFHIYRALKIAEGIGEAEYHGIYVYTSYLSFPHYMVREYFAIIASLFTGRW